MGINELATTLGSLKNDIGNITPTTTAIVGLSTGAIVGAGVGVGATLIATRKKTKKRRKKTAQQYKKRKGKRTKHRKTKHSKRTSHKKIHYTKNHQPYIILASGKARFIKKRSAKRSKKLKGGYY